MRKKGFTLIELLAVIVILAIIAVITVPKIADMISSSRQGGAEDSFYGTLKAAELGYAKALQSNTNLKESACTITDSKITCTNGVTISVSGKTPESGTLIIDSGSTIAKGLTLNGYKCFGDLSTENPCFKENGDVASETLIKKVTTSGDGLYKDTYEEGRYIFRGGTPNNYLTFNNEVWRIVSAENDGTLKIIKDEPLNTRPFDEATTTTTGPRLNSNNTYCSLDTDNKYYGCNAWSVASGIYENGNKKGTVTTDSSLNTYLNGEYYNSIDSNSKSQIQFHKFYNGVVKHFEKYENILIKEKTHIWKGNIALLNVSDWFKATTNSECQPDVNGWYQNELGQGELNYRCFRNNYLYKAGKDWWTLISDENSNNRTIYVNSYGAINRNFRNNDNLSVRPVLYLKASLQLTGTGTSSNPYKIKI